MKPEILLQSEGTEVHTARTAAAACRAAKDFENIGEYEAARDALSAFWPGIGERPRIEGLALADQAELLLRAGALSGWLGSSAQLAGAQQSAKDLISESIRSFEALGSSEKVAEAQTDLAICYWREGAMDEARVLFQQALTLASHPANQLRILVNSTTVEVSTGHLSEALAVLDRAAVLVDGVENEAAIGRYHMQRALVLKELGGAENLDRALIENTAASIHLERANHRRYFTRVENNLGFIFLVLGRYDEALEHLDRARHALIELKDRGTAAQVNETRARVYLAQQRYAEAEKIASASIVALERGGEQSLLAEALQTKGIALARQRRYPSALNTFKRAADIAETGGDPEFAGTTFLTILEELKNFLTPDEIRNLYDQADGRLGEDLSRETMSRLRACARLLPVATTPGTAATSAVSTSFEEEVRRCESNLIRQALDSANGSVTRAAKTLGLTHQGLCYIINNRHKSLLTARAPIRIRRKSVMKK